MGPGVSDPYALTLTAGPVYEPVTLAEAKLHCRVDDDLTEDDALLDDCIAAARKYCEQVLGQALVTQSWTLYLDAFPFWEIQLPRPPLAGVTHVKYRDVGTGTLTTLSPTLYTVDAASRPGRITPAYNQAWPAARYDTNAIEILFEAGEATPSPAVKQAIKLLVGHWYANRESVVIGTIASPLQLTVDALLATEWTGAY